MLVEPLAAGSALLPGYRRIASRIVYREKRFPPDVLWLDVPDTLQEEISDTGNFWLLASLPMAFHLGEPLEISLPVDPILIQNANEIMRTWTRWFPRQRPIAIQAPLLAKPARPNRGHVGLFFTGGVDSFYSLFHFDEAARSNRNGTAGARPIDDLIYVCGFDIPLSKRSAWEGKMTALSEVARQSGKNLIVLVTNLRETRLRSLPWDTVAHGPALAAAGLLLERRFGTLLLSAGGSGIDERTAWGSHPLTDPLFSTSRTQFIRYENKPGRFAKTAFISRFNVALQHLHVCWADASQRNCGQCEKCYRTLTSLEILGLREQAISFPRDAFSLKRLETIHLKNPVVTVLMEELKGPARERGQLDIVRSIDLCVANSRRANAKPGPVLRRLKERLRMARKSLLDRLSHWRRSESQASM